MICNDILPNFDLLIVMCEVGSDNAQQNTEEHPCLDVQIQINLSELHLPYPHPYDFQHTSTMLLS